MPSLMNSAFLLLAMSALLLQGVQGLREGESTEVSANRGKIRGRRQLQEWDPTWGFYIGKCVGTACGGFGDPHIITCDGVFYDCQGIGVFTVMQNELFTMQATFVDVGPENVALVATENFLTQGASITNDFMIEYTPLEGDATILQFSVGDVASHDGTYPAEVGCEIDSYYHEYFDYSIEPNVESCREGCEQREDCEYFSYWYDGYCFYHCEGAKKHYTDVGWTRTLSGDVDQSTCGQNLDNETLLATEEENEKHTRLGAAACPLLLFVNGDMIDISDVFYDGDLFGQEDDDIYVEMIYGQYIHVTYKLASGDYAVVELRQAGAGLGEPWGCHFDFFICLPESDKDMWSETTTGILGTPDNNYNNEWTIVNEDGSTTSLEYPVASSVAELEEDMMEYCLDNWCVEQDNSLMTYHGNLTFEDYKCTSEDYVAIVERNCVLTMEKINEVCAEMNPLMMHACQVDCCFGGCDEIEEVAEEIEELREFDEDEDKQIIDPPSFDKCEEDIFEDTSDTVCGEGVEAVTLLKTHGSEELPDGEIFYGINLHSEPSSDIGHRTVKFKVNNPFPDTADMYVKYEKAVMDDMADPHCDQMLGTPSGCDSEAEDIEALCRTFEGVDPFAVVQVYFVSNGISSVDSPTIDNCCEPQPYDGFPGTVSYTFEVACGCPSESIA